MDSSGSINRNYDRQLDFAANLTQNFDLGPDDVRFGGVIFSDTAEKLFDLKDYSDHENLSQAIKKAKYMGKMTSTDLALTMVAHGMFEKVNGGRDNARKIVIVMTDGESTFRDKTKTAADKLKKQGVTIISIGIADAKEQELKDIASGPDDVFQVAGFSALDRIANTVADRTCHDSTPSRPTV
ncbi:collagen alpha-1(XX) chain [Aplysia californica]|uniref:Collagen alpha-1(XX) chain n=1 Tax=Aplysia californica TaxID=6500 RepID=A0ABM1A7P3_APLCA|nr:collagen alpha-1(XX) chain [Aplysia californica]